MPRLHSHDHDHPGRGWSGPPARLLELRDAPGLAERAGQPANPRCTHFVGFRDDRYWSAVKVFGRPHFIHRRWDPRARREIGEGDLVVFATGDEDQPVSRFNASDIDEELLA